RGPDPFVPVLHADGETDGILHAIAAPRGAHAALYRTQRLSIGVATLESSGDQLLPNVGQVVDASTEQIDALTAGDLGVQLILLGHFSNGYQCLRSDLTTRNARHDRIRALA